MEQKEKSDDLPILIPKFLGIRHLLSTFRYSFDGFVTCFKHEVAFRQEIVLGIINIVLVFILSLSVFARVYLLAIWFLLICVELLNSAIEAVVDLASPQWHELAKRAKDLGSAAVFCVLIVFFGSWAVVAWILLSAYLNK